MRSTIFLVGILHHFSPRDIAASLADSCEQESQEVVYLGGGADSTARVAVYCLLLDCDNGAQTANMVYLGALELAEHIAGVCRECFDITTLAFGKDCVESKR